MATHEAAQQVGARRRACLHGSVLEYGEQVGGELGGGGIAPFRLGLECLHDDDGEIAAEGTREFLTAFLQRLHELIRRWQ